jgi:hypothetical protein
MATSSGTIPYSKATRTCIEYQSMIPTQTLKAGYSPLAEDPPGAVTAMDLELDPSCALPLLQNRCCPTLPRDAEN